MITAKELPNGNLLLTAGNECRSHIKDELEHGYWSAFMSIFEDYYTNGRYEPFDAGDANPFVGLTSAPCIAESMTVEDDGTRKVEGRLWWYPDYAIRDPLDDLKNKGRTVFQLAA